MFAVFGIGVSISTGIGIDIGIGLAIGWRCMSIYRGRALITESIFRTRTAIYTHTQTRPRQSVIRTCAVLLPDGQEERSGGQNTTPYAYLPGCIIMGL